MSTDEFQKGFDDFKFDFVADQKTELPTASAYKEHIEGGTFIVTGSNTGLGLYAAQALVATGAAKVILAVRSQAKGDEAVAKIEAETGIKGVADVWTLEMGSYKSIEAFGKKVQSLDRLDGISENAAVAHDKFSTAEIPAETSIAVNVLGTMALAGLVFPKLQKTAKKYGKTTHLSIVGSGVAFQTDAREELEAADKSGKDIIDFFNEDNREFTARLDQRPLILLPHQKTSKLTPPIQIPTDEATTPSRHPGVLH
jgi:short-subunit dehydrogenase involved in D-alanine esterification of teichoic acids